MTGGRDAAHPAREPRPAARARRDRPATTSCACVVEEPSRAGLADDVRALLGDGVVEVRLETPDAVDGRRERAKRAWSARPRTSCSPRTWRTRASPTTAWVGSSPSCSTRRPSDAAGPARSRGLQRLPRPDRRATSTAPTSSPSSARPAPGKSSIIDAICFALYGTVPRYGDDRLVAPVITQGSTEARVSLTFEIDGEEYVATRVVRRHEGRRRVDEGSTPRARHRGARRRRSRNERRRSPSSSACRSITSPAASCCRRASSPSSCTTSRRIAKT